MLAFAETVRVRPHHVQPIGGLESDWTEGLWVGRSAMSDEHIVLTEQGTTKSRTVRRRPEGGRFLDSVLSKVKELPWASLATSLHEWTKYEEVTAETALRDPSFIVRYAQSVGPTPGRHHTAACQRRRAKWQQQQEVEQKPPVAEPCAERTTADGRRAINTGSETRTGRS